MKQDNAPVATISKPDAVWRAIEELGARADVTEITRLPRVGPALAQRIVAWRDAHGPFGSLAALDSVPGVGPNLLQSLRPYVSFSGVVP